MYGIIYDNYSHTCLYYYCNMNICYEQNIKYGLKKYTCNNNTTMYTLRINLILRIYVRELNIAVFLIATDSFY